MNAQNNTEHPAQNMPYSHAESPEVGKERVSSYEEAWKASTQNRSQEDIFEDIVADIRRDSPSISDSDARQAARNLIAFVTEMIHVAKQLK